MIVRLVRLLVCGAAAAAAFAHLMMPVAIEVATTRADCHVRRNCHPGFNVSPMTKLASRKP